MRRVAAIATLAVLLVGCASDEPDVTASDTDTASAPAESEDPESEDPEEPEETKTEAAASAEPEEPEPTEATEPEEEAAYSDECGNLMAQAAAVSDAEDSVEDTDPAIVACASVEAFSAASADHPDALDGTDVTTWLSNRCLYSEDEAVTSSAICAEISG